MNDPADAEIEAATRAVLGPYYAALRREGVSEDEALRRVADRQRAMRAEWEDAKQEDAADE